MKPSALLLILLGTFACTLGPDYKPPQMETPTQYENARPDSAESHAPGPDAAWWTVFGDSQLVALVEQALMLNHDIRIAETRILEARAARDAAAGKRLPQVGAAVDVSHQRASEESVGLGGLADAGLVDLENTVYRPGFQASWELDIFGKTRRQVEAAAARVAASQARAQGITLTVIAETCSTYLELRGLQNQYRLAAKNIRIQSESLQRVAAKKSVGLASGLDVARAQSLLSGTRARLPGLQTRMHAATIQLGVLTGQSPQTMLPLLATKSQLRDPPQAVGAGLPVDLLRRRPDLIAAERSLHAATAEVGVAVASLYPRIGLDAGYAWEATAASNLFQAGSATWLLGGLVQWPIFQGGRLRANVRAVKARNEAAYLAFEQTYLKALADVEIALQAYRDARAERDSLRNAVTAAQKAVDMADVLYDKGLGDYLAVLDAERTLTQQEDQLAMSETRMHQRTVQLYKALGGGWHASP